MTRQGGTHFDIGRALYVVCTFAAVAYTALDGVVIDETVGQCQLPEVRKET